MIEPAPPPPDVDLGDGASAELSLKRIQTYIWARYVEFQRPPFELDEKAALAFYADHYVGRPLTEDSECFYYGILAYEHAYASSTPDKDLLRIAVQAFEAYRNRTDPHFTWDVVEDRYADAMDSL